MRHHHDVFEGQLSSSILAMIKIFEVKLNVLYSVDYTGAIDNFSDCEQWTETNG